MRTTTRAAAVVLTATACIGVTSCVDRGHDLTAGPSVTSPRREVTRRPTPSPASVVLARTAAQAIRSGRVEVHSGPMAMTARFDGEDVEVLAGASTGTDAAGQGSAGVEMLVVGGRAYARTGDTYLRVPFGAQALSSSLGTRITDTIAAIRRLLEKATVGDPGTPMTVDGIDVLRYRAELTGTGVADLLDGTGARRAAPPVDDATRRVVDDALGSAKVTLVGDIDGDGTLRRLEITVTPGTPGSPDCSLMRFLPTTTVTLSGIDQPQGITAPPAEQVRDLAEVDPTEMLGAVARGLHAEGGSEPGATPSTAPTACPR